MTDLLIGQAMNYDWSILEPFACSAAWSGFAGDKVLLTKNLTSEAESNLKSLGFRLVPAPEIDFPPAKYLLYVSRFLLIHKFLVENPGYRFVVTCDTRDVVLQSDPTAWLEKNIGDAKIVAASEYITHRDQPGNAFWIEQAFREVGSWMLDRPVLCSGYISGRAEYMRDLSLGIYLTARHLTDKVWGSDQPAYNFVMSQKPYEDVTILPSLTDRYTINCHVFATSDGRAKMTDAPPPRSYVSGWNYGIPDLNGFVAIHQYDRIPDLVTMFRCRYRLEDPAPPQIAALTRF